MRSLRACNFFFFIFFFTARGCRLLTNDAEFLMRFFQSPHFPRPGSLRPWIPNDVSSFCVIFFIVFKRLIRIQEFVWHDPSWRRGLARCQRPFLTYEGRFFFLFLFISFRSSCLNISFEASGGDMLFRQCSLTKNYLLQQLVTRLVSKENFRSKKKYIYIYTQR